jgi:hypothetical protein
VRVKYVMPPGVDHCSVEITLASGAVISISSTDFDEMVYYLAPFYQAPHESSYFDMSKVMC